MATIPTCLPFRLPPFIAFIREAPHPLLHHFLGLHCTPDTVMVLAAVCQDIRLFLKGYAEDVWNIDRVFTPWFPDNVGFRHMLRQTEAIISGSTALRFFAPKIFRHSHDLDIYVPLKGLLVLGRWLGKAGYVFQSGVGQAVPFDCTALRASSRMSRPRRRKYDYDETSIFEVFHFVRIFTHPLFPNNNKIDLIAVNGDPCQQILEFHSSTHTQIPLNITH